VDTIEIDDALRDAFASHQRLMPYLHLSLQHGADLILKRMKRRHLRTDAIRHCAELKRLRTDIVFGADLIAGFPTETEAHFQDSLDIVDACGLTWLHVFPYSARPGTPAAKMPQVSSQVIKERAQRLRVKGEQARAQHLAALDGTVAELLVEHGGRGRTPGFAEVMVDGLPGTLMTARLAHVTDAHGKARLDGRAINLETAA
jgi:threonylcarbamoyladenosine tRNA methylthiotransferase MtaB